MVKKIFLCLLVGLVMSNFAMKADLSDSDEETVDRTPKNVTILFGKALEQTFVLTKEDIARKYFFLNKCATISRSELPQIQLSPDISIAALDTALNLTWAFRKAWGHNKILSLEQLQAHIKPEMIAPVLHVLLQLRAQPNLIVAIGLLAREPAYKSSLQKSLAQNPALQKKLSEKLKWALKVHHPSFLKKPELMPDEPLDRLATLTDIWQGYNFFLKSVSVPVATQTEAPGGVDASAATESVKLVDNEMQAGVGEMAMKLGEVQTEVSKTAHAQTGTPELLSSSAATETVAFVEKAVQASMDTSFGDVQTESSMSKMVHAQIGTPELLSSSAATETVAFVEKAIQASVDTSFGDVQTESSMSKMVHAQTGTPELLSSSAATESVELVDNGSQAGVGEMAMKLGEVQTEAPGRADSSAATESVKLVDNEMQAGVGEVALKSGEAQTEAPERADSSAATESVKLVDNGIQACVGEVVLKSSETQTEAPKMDARVLTKNIWQRAANSGIGEGVKWRAINKKFDKKSNPVYVMAQAIAKEKRSEESVASEAQTEEAAHVASPIPASLFFVSDRMPNLKSSRQKCARDKKLGDQCVILSPVPAVSFSPRMDYTPKPVRTSQPLLWPAWFAQFFSRWLPVPEKPINRDEPIISSAVPSNKFNVAAGARRAKFLLLGAMVD